MTKVKKEDMKDELRDHGLPVSGTKDEVEDRVDAASLEVPTQETTRHDIFASVEQVEARDEGRFEPDSGNEQTVTQDVIDARDEGRE